MAILLDTGVLLRLVDRNDPLHAAVRAAWAQGDELVATWQNIVEFWNVCTRPSSARGGLGLMNTEANRRLRLIERITRRLPESAAAYPIWRNFVVSLGISGVQVHDAKLAALMQVHGVTRIMTLNANDFARFRGIVAIDPRGLVPAGP